MRVLITGAAGFIGMHTAIKLLHEGYQIVGIDNLNDYYDIQLKEHRLKLLSNYDRFHFIKADLSDRETIESVFQKNNFQRVIHLGAQAGVRHSIDNPYLYAESNLLGTLTILEGCRKTKVEHLVFASSSSIYGLSTKTPFSEQDQTDSPVSFYAATKKSNELMAHSYSYLYGIPMTGLRFFTVYGPYGRPDMAPWLFTEAILHNEPIKIFNNGKMLRDFTYIDDIVEGVFRIQAKPPKIEKSGQAPYRICNIGNNQPIELSRFIKAIEMACDREAEKIYLPMQLGDVPITYANTAQLEKLVNYKPSTTIETGIQEFVDWYFNYYKNSHPLKN